MKKSLLALLALTAGVTVSLAFTHDGPYKNLKVLPKNITEKQMDSVMHHFTASLNVKCNFCHVRDTATKKMNFASDENKHKLIARDMMRMTNELNEKYFDHTGQKITLESRLEVTCYTCHHGSTEPARMAPPPPPRPAAPIVDTVRKQ